MHKLGCQYGVSANWLLQGSLGLHHTKKEQVVMGDLGQSGLKSPDSRKILSTKSDILAVTLTVFFFLTSAEKVWQADVIAQSAHAD